MAASRMREESTRSWKKKKEADMERNKKNASKENKDEA